MATDDSGLVSRVCDVINRHGHAFQYAVIRKLQALFQTRQRWLFEVSEFPVLSLTGDTRVDFIVRPKATRCFLVCECKRANPALKHWCFVRAPYVRRNRGKDLALVEWLSQEYELGRRYQSVRAANFGPLHNAYHLGYEVKDPQEKGDAGNGRGAIEQAAGQVFRGVYGLLAIQAGSNHTTSTHPLLDTILMPAIFTTAQLWTLAADLGGATLSTGELNASASQLQRVPWLYWQYPVSASLRTGPLSPEKPLEFADLLESHYLRTVAVINEAGIEPFFDQFTLFDDSPTPLHAVNRDATQA